jgi:type IX secretion system PorP/SprF family membrane protein
MKNKTLLFSLAILFLSISKVDAQDAFFRQWESMPLHFNPALTGNFDGMMRFRAKYRNQWESFLGDASYRTSAASAEFKFKNGESRKLSLGTYGIIEKAGSLDLTTQSFNLSSSIIQRLRKSEKGSHFVGVGFNIGFAGRSIDYTNARWAPGITPDTTLNYKTNFIDLSSGIYWQYNSSSHFSAQLGTALSHLNRPNVSFRENSEINLYMRLNLHGSVEIPITKKFSFVPSFLYLIQKPGDYILFGGNTKLYLNNQNNTNIQLGFFAQTIKVIDETEVGVYVFTASVEIKSLLIGLAYDRYKYFDSDAYELTLGYIIGRKSQN